MNTTSLKALAATAFLAIVLLASCTVYTREDLGDSKTQTYNLKDFNKLELSTVDEVVFVPDSTYSIVITGPEKLMQGIEVGIDKNHCLYIEKKNKQKLIQINRGNITTNGEPLTRAVIHAPSLERVAVLGSTDFTVQGVLSPSRFKAEIAGSGSIVLPAISCEQFSGSIAGSGDIKTDSISCTTYKVDIAGSGDVKGNIYNATTTKMSIAGSGDINLTFHSCEHAVAEISGSGDITLRGTLGTLKKSVAGSGDINTNGLKLGQ